MAFAARGLSVVRFGFALAALAVLGLAGLSLSEPTKPEVKKANGAEAETSTRPPAKASVGQRAVHSAAGHIASDSSLERFLAADVLAALAPQQRLETLLRYRDVHERMIVDYEQKLVEPDPEGRHPWYAEQLQQARARLEYIEGQIVACRRELRGASRRP